MNPTPDPPARATGPPICFAPARSLRLGARGVVHPCGPAPLVLGDLRHDRLGEVWAGAARRRLEAAVAAGDTSLGCGPCAAALQRGEPDAPPRRHAALAHPGPTGGPAAIALALDPDSGPDDDYDERFHADLAALLGQLVRVELGGPDPFRTPAYDRVWGALAAAARRPAVVVSTPARRPGPEARRCLTAFPVDVVVRLAATAAPADTRDPGPTRVEAAAALDELAATVPAGGGRLRAEVELRRETWPEVGELLLLAERRGLPADVTVADHPDRARLDTLPLALLADVVTSLERQGHSLAPRLEHNAPAWQRVLDVVHHLHDLAERRSHPADEPPDLRMAAVFAPRDEVAPGSGDEADADLATTDPRVLLEGSLRCDLDDRTVWSSPSFLGVPAAACRGRTFYEVGLAIDELLGVAGPTDVDRTVDRHRLRWRIHYPTWPEPTVVDAVTVPERAPDGSLTGTYTRAAARRDEGGSPSGEATP